MTASEVDCETHIQGLLNIYKLIESEYDNNKDFFFNHVLGTVAHLRCRFQETSDLLHPEDHESLNDYCQAWLHNALCEYKNYLDMIQNSAKSKDIAGVCTHVAYAYTQMAIIAKAKGIQNPSFSLPVQGYVSRRARPF